MTKSNQYVWADIRSSVEQLMEESRGQVDLSKQKYWYPLATPSYWTEEVLGALESMVTFKTSMWKKTAEFEEAFGAQFGGEAVMVNSGSSADLLVALALLDESGGPLKRGAKVLAPSVTWPTQIWSLLMAGFQVTLVDTNPKTLNMNLEDLRSKITDEHKAISVVHLLGNPTNMTEVLNIARQHNLIVVEDACEALGSSHAGKMVGTQGTAGTFSFFFSHHLVTMEGGMVITTTPELAERFRLLRAHGWSRNLKNPPQSLPGRDSRYAFLGWGLNVRPTELQAAFGLAQLKRWPEFQRARAANARQFLAGLARETKNLTTMEVAATDSCNWFALPVLVDETSGVSKTKLVAELEERGVETRPIVAGNLARQPAVSGLSGIEHGELVGADLIDSQGFYVGLGPTENPEQMDRLIESLAESESIASL